MYMLIKQTKRNFSRLIQILFVITLISLQACGGGSDETPSNAGTNQDTGDSTPNNTVKTIDLNVNSSSAVGVQIPLSATVSGAEGDITYSWSITNTPTGSSEVIIDENQPTAFFTPDVAGSYSIQVTVNDGISTASQATTFMAELGNVTPIAIISPNAIAGLNSSVQVNGTESYDANNDSLSYQWSFLSRPAGSQTSFNNPYASQPTFTVDAGGEYIIQLVVNDGEFDSVPVTATIIASEFTVSISWPANNDTTVGYTIYVGPAIDNADQLAKILVKDAQDWKPATPSAVLGGDEILNLLPSGSTQACFSIKAYNAAGLSEASSTSCVQLPII